MTMLLIERNQAIAIFSSLFAAIVCSGVAVSAAMKRRKGAGR